jgi:hypothetical protein
MCALSLEFMNTHYSNKLLFTSGTFLSGVHKLISACRLTRAFVDCACSMIAKQSVSISEVHPCSLLRYEVF